MNIKKRKLSLLAFTMLAIISLSAFAQFARADTPIIASAYLDSGDGVLRVSAALYKDTSELDPNYNYYAIKATLQDRVYANDPNRGPMWAGVRIAVSLSATETPTNHQPQAGTVYQQVPITFSYSYISFSALLPARTTSFTESTDANYRYFDWAVDGYSGLHGWVFKDWSDFNIGIRVPQGYRPTVYIQGLGNGYVHTQYGDFKFLSENVYWVTLSAPLGMSMPQGLPTPVSLPKTPDMIPLSADNGS